MFNADALPEDGWHGIESTHRWTDGSAALDLPEAQGADTFLDVAIVGTVSYPVERQMAG